MDCFAWVETPPIRPFRSLSAMLAKRAIRREKEPLSKDPAFDTQEITSDDLLGLLVTSITPSLSLRGWRAELRTSLNFYSTKITGASWSADMQFLNHY